MFPGIFQDTIWQMSLGERAAIEGILAQLKPRVAIEIGSMQGACLRRIAAHAEEVHSLDLEPPTLELPANVTLHTGNSHELLPPLLSALEARERNVDLVVVDGDHTATGVRQDIEDLLNSRAVARSIILIHDTANEMVRQGLDAVRFAAWPKVVHVDLDWIPGRLFVEPGLRNELWYGLGLVIVDAGHLAYGHASIHEQRYAAAAPLLAHARDLALAREFVPSAAAHANGATAAARAQITVLEAELGAMLAHRAGSELLEIELTSARRRLTALEAEVTSVRERAARLEREAATLRLRYDGSERALANIKGSASWRMTAPLRSAKRLVRTRPR